MRVALFVTCLVDLFRPSVGFAAVRLLERLGAEVVEPMAQTCGDHAVEARFGGKVAIHDSCSALRELGVHAAPRVLIDRLGAERVELKDAEACCGFGGTFCVKYPDISARMVSDKAQAVKESGAHVLVSGDPGCLLNIAGRLKRMESGVRVYHQAELLAGMTDAPGIGEGRKT